MYYFASSLMIKFILSTIKCISRWPSDYIIQNFLESRNRVKTELLYKEKKNVLYTHFDITDYNVVMSSQWCRLTETGMVISVYRLHFPDFFVNMSCVSRILIKKHYTFVSAVFFSLDMVAIFYFWCSYIHGEVLKCWNG